MRYKVKIEMAAYEWVEAETEEEAIEIAQQICWEFDESQPRYSAWPDPKGGFTVKRFGEFAACYELWVDGAIVGTIVRHGDGMREATYYSAKHFPSTGRSFGYDWKEARLFAATGQR